MDCGHEIPNERIPALAIGVAGSCGGPGGLSDGIQANPEPVKYSQKINSVDVFPPSTKIILLIIINTELPST